MLADAPSHVVTLAPSPLILLTRSEELARRVRRAARCAPTPPDARVACVASGIEPSAQVLHGRAPLAVRRAATRDAALALLACEPACAVLLDIVPPEGFPLDVIARVHEQVPEAPVVLLAPAYDHPLAMRALAMGAQDVLVPAELTGPLLHRTLRYAAERQRLQAALQTMALVDELTGLHNRRGFLTLARQQLKLAARMERRLSLVFVDLDGLKAINDRCGHAEGDRALLETAEVLRETFRDADIRARIGGDEFAVLAMDGAGPTRESWTVRLQRAVEARRVRRPGPPLALSTGVAVYDPDLPCTLEELLARADARMYAEKRTRRADAPAMASSGMAALASASLPLPDLALPSPRAD